ncbi:hypothetical protein Gpo141_00004430 [Globisporangium polare]
MKLVAFAIAALLAFNVALATPDTIATKVISANEAFEAVKGLELPTGVTLTGAVDAVKEPAKKTEGAEAGELATTTDDHDDHKEWFGSKPL